MKRIVTCLLTLCCLASPAYSDTRISLTTASGVRSYQAVLPGNWQEMPPMAGTQATYGLSVGTQAQKICTFRSDERSDPIPFTKENGWAAKTARAFTDEVRSDPEQFLGRLSQSRPNLTLEDNFATSESDQVKFTIIYSYDDISMVNGAAYSLRVVAYETQLFTSYVFVQTTCVTPRGGYDPPSARLFRSIRDSVSVKARTNGR